jgi:hypothetical protein
MKWKVREDVINICLITKEGVETHTGNEKSMKVVLSDTGVNSVNIQRRLDLDRIANTNLKLTIQNRLLVTLVEFALCLSIEFDSRRKRNSFLLLQLVRSLKKVEIITRLAKRLFVF